MLECHFNKGTDLYSATLLKKTLVQVFSGFLIFKTSFFRIPSGNCFVSTEKYFTNKTEMTPLKKKCEVLVEKTVTYVEKKLKQYLDKVFLSFYSSKISLFLFFLVSTILEIHKLTKPTEDLSTIENISILR